MQTKISAIYHHYNTLRNNHLNNDLTPISDEIILKVTEGEWEFWIYQDTGNRTVQIEAAKLDAPRIDRNRDGVFLPVAETFRTFDFYASGVLIELVPISEGNHSEVYRPDDEEVAMLIDLLYLAPFQKKMIQVIESDRIPAVIAEELSAIPAGDNPFNHDLNRVGTEIFPGLMAMYSTIQTQQVILVNTKTGRRVALDISGMDKPV